MDFFGVLSLIPMHIVSESITRTSPPSMLRFGNSSWKNIHLFSSIIEIDGFLIGGASQSSKKFIDIIKNYYK